MATRFYFSSTATPSITPNFSGSWTRNSDATRRIMSVSKDNSAMTTASTWGGTSPTADQSALQRQYISNTLKTGTVFSTSDTFKCVVRCQESGSNDNINRQPIGIFIYSSDGLTLRSTLFDVAHTGPNTTEWVNSPTGLTNKQFAAVAGTNLTSSYTTVSGDVLVVELGSQVSAAGGTGVTGNMSFGADSVSDCAYDESGTSANNPWIEFSNNFGFVYISPNTETIQLTENMRRVIRVKRAVTETIQLTENIRKKFSRFISESENIFKNIIPRIFIRRFKNEIVNAGRSYAGEILKDNPGAYYRMDESSGLILDSSGNNNNSYSFGGSPSYRRIGALGEGPNRAIAFTVAGWPSYFGVNNSDTLDFGDRLTLELWLKREYIGILQTILDKGAGAYQLILDSSDHICLTVGNGGATIASSTATISDTTMFHHILVTKNGSAVYIYIDGVDVTGSISNQTLTNNSIDLNIGSQSPPASYLYGLVADEIALYSTDLSYDRVINHFNARFYSETSKAFIRPLNEMIQTLEIITKITISLGEALKRLISEAEQISEAVKRNLTILRRLGENQSIGEIVSSSIFLRRVFNETLQINEYMNKLFVKRIQEIIDISEIINRFPFGSNIIKLISEISNINELIEHNQLFHTISSMIRKIIASNISPFQ